MDHTHAHSYFTKAAAFSEIFSVVSTKDCFSCCRCEFSVFRRTSSDVTMETKNQTCEC